MITFPRGVTARTAFRIELERRARYGMPTDSRLAARSERCRNGFHARNDGGCLDDGTGCLCACHDQKDTP